jgi:hypothetical protein
MKFDELIVKFKGEENKEVAMLVLEDSGLRKLLAAWPMVTIHRTHPHPNLPLEGEGTMFSTWEELWQAVNFEEKEIADLAGVSPGVMKGLLKRAIGLRLIYPDGSLHALAKMALQARIKAAMQG